MSKRDDRLWRERIHCICNFEHNQNGLQMFYIKNHKRYEIIARPVEGPKIVNFRPYSLQRSDGEFSEATRFNYQEIRKHAPMGADCCVEGEVFSRLIEPKKIRAVIAVQYYKATKLVPSKNNS